MGGEGERKKHRSLSLGWVFRRLWVQMERKDGTGLQTSEGE